MSVRRIEITVPKEWGEAVRQCLEDPNRCNLGDVSEKPNMIVELAGITKAIFIVTLPGPAVGPTLTQLRYSFNKVIIYFIADFNYSF